MIKNFLVIACFVLFISCSANTDKHSEAVKSSKSSSASSRISNSESSSEKIFKDMDSELK